MNLPFSEQFNKAWQEWITYRKERHLPCYKPMGLKKTLTRLCQLANNNEAEAIAIIDYSISQNYQGLFKEKSYGTKNNSRTEVQAELNSRLEKWQQVRY